MEQVQIVLTTSYVINKLVLDWTNSLIEVTLTDNRGTVVTCSYTGAAASGLMSVLNTIDLSVKSLHRRILEKLLADGKLPTGTTTGTITGTP